MGHNQQRLVELSAQRSHHNLARGTGQARYELLFHSLAEAGDDRLEVPVLGKSLK